MADRLKMTEPPRTPSGEVDYPAYDAKMQQDLQRLLQGQRGSPDLPSRAAQQAYTDYPTDQVIQDFINRFGETRAQMPGGPPPGYVPTPRERYPGLEPGPLGPMERQVPPGVTLRPGETGMGPEPEGQAEPSGDTSDEEMLEKVQKGMGAPTPPPGSNMKWEDVDEDSAALEANPTPENVQAFTEYWGQDKLPQSLQQGGQGE